MVQARALVAFGSLRAADKVKVSLDHSWSNDYTMLFDALRSADIAPLKKDFKTSYRWRSNAEVSSSAWFKEKDLALMLLQPDLSSAQRLIKTVKIATSGVTSSPQMIWDALGAATPDDVKALKDEIDEGLEWRAGRDQQLLRRPRRGEHARLKAMIGIGQGGVLDDPVVKPAHARADRLGKHLRHDRDLDWLPRGRFPDGLLRQPEQHRQPVPSVRRHVHGRAGEGLAESRCCRRSVS